MFLISYLKELVAAVAWVSVDGRRESGLRRKATVLSGTDLSTLDW